MDIQYVLFSPKGRLDPRAFGRGLILLTGAMMLIQIAVALVSPAFGMLQYPLVYAYICVFGKRLHDAGHTAWLYLAFLAGYFVVMAVFSAMLLQFLSPEAFSMQAEFQTLAQSGQFSAALEEIAKHAEELARKSVLTTVVAFLMASGVVGLIAGRLPSDPSENRHGPPLGGSGPANTVS